MSSRALLALSILALPAPAMASSAVLLPRTGGSGVNVETEQRVVEATRRVLENDGWTLFELAEVSTDLPPRLAACGPDDRCAHELRSVMGVDVAVGLRIWGDGDRVERLAVVFVGVRGAGQRALSTIDPEVPLEIATAEVVRTAARTRAGGPTDELSPVLSLAPEDPNRTEASPLNFVFGTLLVLGSAPLLGYGINTAVRDGDCVTETAAGCTQRISFGDGAAVFTTLGVAVLAGGVIAFTVQPFRVAVRADTESAALTLEGRF